MTYKNPGLFQANLDAIKEFVPDRTALVAGLRNHTPYRSVLTGELEDGSLNLETDGQKQFEPDALTAASGRVANFLKKPDRYYLDQPAVSQNAVKLHSNFRKALYAKLRGWEYNAEPTADAGYLVCFGIGIGIDVALLLQNLPVSNLVIVEPDIDRLYASMHVLPWSGIIAGLKEKRGVLKLFCDGDAGVLANESLQMLRGVDHALVDGSYIYRLGGAAILDQAAAAFTHNLSTVAGSMGFFEDEALMFKNTVENLRRHRFHRMHKSPIQKREIPAVVVGSGPSVDGCIQSIANNADQALVFSSGTSISILKRNGITPDFHTQYENVAINYEVIKAIHDEFGLAEVTLVAPTTVDPRIPDLFDETVFYFRDSVTPTRLYATPDETLTLSGPTVTNLACRAAVSFGIREMLLYGVDLGAPAPDLHHSKDSIYNYSKDLKSESTGQTMGEVGGAIPMNVPVEGNRRKQVFTSRVMILARMFYEKLFETYSWVKAYNCSDGVKIGGVQAVAPEKIVFGPPKIEKRQAIGAIMEEMPRHAPGGIYDREVTEAFRARVVEILDTMDVALDKNRKTDFDHLYSDVRDCLQQGQQDTAHGVDPAARILMSGTLILILQTGHYLYRRVDPEQRAAFMEIYVDCFKTAVAALRKEACELIDTYLM